jgi:nucleoid-associated protein YgaU
VGVLVILALALIGALLYLFVFMSQTEESVPPLEAQKAPAEETQESEEQPSGDTETVEESEGTVAADDSEAAAERQAEEHPDAGQGRGAASETESEDAARTLGTAGDMENWEDGVWYRIRWGDTLWGISSSFYNTPWFFNEIADQNDINNPDRIYAQDKIFIPKPE